MSQDPRIEVVAKALYEREGRVEPWEDAHKENAALPEEYYGDATAAVAALDKAATITTREQFEALPIGTVVRDCIGQVAERQEDFWANTLSGRDRMAVISFPARVIHWGTE